MKKVLFAALIAVAAWSCNSNEDQVIPKNDATEYEVDFTLNGLNLVVDDLTPGTKLKTQSVDGEKVNVDVVLVAYSKDTPGHRYVNTFENEDFNVGESKNIKLFLTAGNYEVYAIAVKDLKKYNVDFDNMNVTQTTHDASEDFWIGKSDLTVTAKTHGAITLNQNYSIVQWFIKNITLEHKKIEFFGDIVSGVSYKTLPTTRKRVEKVGFACNPTEKTMVKKFFTFPGFGLSDKGLFMDHKIIVHLDNGSTKEIKTQFQKMEPCKIYKLNVDLTNDAGIVLESSEWNDIPVEL